MKSTLTLVIIAVAVLFGSANIASAHEQKASLTSITFNGQVGTVEVVHRFSLHDAEHAVKHVLGKDADIYNSETTQAQFADYVYRHFSISGPSGNAMQLAFVGFEIEGRFFWIYQEMNTPDALTWSVRHSALQELWPSQINTVNIEAPSGIKTLVFSNDLPVQLVNVSD